MVHLVKYLTACTVSYREASLALHSLTVHEDLSSFLDDQHGINIGHIILVYLLWADDLILIADTMEGLQRQIDGLEQFCRKWHMIVNLVKTKVCVYNNGKKNRILIN